MVSQEEPDSMSIDGLGGSPELNRRLALKTLGASAVAAGIGGATVSGIGADIEPDEPDPNDPPTARGTVYQVLVTDVVPGATVRLYDGDELVAEAEARFPDDPPSWFVWASYVFRDDQPDVDLTPGEAYEVTQVVDGEESPRSDPVEVLDASNPEPGTARYETLYDSQTLEPTDEGEIGYLQARDGTDLAYQLLFPPEEVAQAPYPTLVIYDGYAPSVNLPGDAVIIDQIVNELGYALVAVQKRGTQCAAGKYDFFERLQILDGYDIIETVASQDWSDGVGMAGGSYSGYSQFFVASTQPPSLDAIAPGMPVGDFYRDVGYTGGILNPAFAAAWAASRDEAAHPDTDGRGDLTERVLEDERCLKNQALRPTSELTMQRLRQSPYMVDFYQERSPWAIVDQIEVPILLNLSWQDEQTGSRPTRLQEQFDGDIPVRFVAGNGDHNIYLADAVVDDLMRFFDYYVREEIPDDETDEFDSFEDAFAAYEDEDPVQIYWENDQNLHPRFESTYTEWPPAETWELYFQPDGTLGADAPTTDHASTTYEYRPSQALSHLVDRDDSGRLIWEPRDEGRYAAFVSEPLDNDRVCLGSGLAELYLNATHEDTDVEVVISEVRPDGKETYVQSGWLRASHRAEDDSLAKPRRPWHTHTEADATPLPDDGFAKMRVEFHPFGHVFREGSRIQITVENPGGNRDLWGFTVVNEDMRTEVAHFAGNASKVELPLIPEETAGVESLPECGELRNQPCRDAVVSDRVSVSGTVRRGEESFGDIEIAFLPEDETPGVVTRTDADGTYTAPLVPGSYTATVELTDAAPVAQSVTVEEDGDTADIIIGPPALSEAFDPPRDHDGDGLYEDITGDGELTVADVQALFDNLDSPEVQAHASFFNFSGTGSDRATVFDVQALFNRIDAE